MGRIINPYSGISSGAGNGILLFLQNPTGGTDANFVPVPLVNAASNGALGGNGTFDLDTDGYVQDTTSYSKFLTIQSLAAVTTRRKFEMWGKTKNAALSDNYGVEIIINRDSGATVNYYTAILVYRTASAAFELYLGELNAGVYTSRGTVAFSTAIDEPVFWNLILYEQGDTVAAQAFLYESDTATDAGGVSLSYQGTPRVHKTNTRCSFGLINTPGDQWLIRGCMIQDVN